MHNAFVRLSNRVRFILNNSPRPRNDPLISQVAGTDCNANDNGNAGCGVKVNKANSYGPGFNNAGGGYYAMERTNNFIKMWFWTRNGGGAPSDLTSGAASVNTDNWGTPWAWWPNTASCNLASHFNGNNIIINLTLCE